MTLALALQRAGVQCRVIEGGARGDRLGTGISLLGNALRALDKVGLADICIEKGFGWDKVHTFDGTGKLLNEFTSPRTFRPDSPSAIGIMRNRLAEILEEHARSGGARIDYGTTAEVSGQDENGAIVSLSDGTSDRGDLVVAAEGVYSRTRGAIFGDEVKPTYTGQGGWRYTAPRPSNLAGLILYRLGGRAVGGLPLSQKLCYYFFLENPPTHVRIPEEKLPELLRERLAPFTAPELRNAVEAMTPSSHISYRPFDVLLMPQPWYKGRIVLLGDAAHALTPQLTSGGGMAIEDAIVLTEELSKSSDLSEALQAYSTRRGRRVSAIYDISLQICQLEQMPSNTGERSMQLLMQGYGMLAQPF
jgi:2-polyprenyl-6-methoxyphenol hydroxylase-like FAD-dependent oxidoreductase